jgi:hypothetical protein
MSVRKMKFVLVNDMEPGRPSVCAACSRPLERGYLHDLSTKTRYCAIECYPRSLVVSGMLRLIAPSDPFKLTMTWPQLTLDVTSALFDGARGDQRD